MDQTRREIVFAAGVALAASFAGCTSTAQEAKTMTHFTPEWHSIETPDGARGDEIRFALLPDLGVALFFNFDSDGYGGGGLTVLSISDLNQSAI